MGSPQLNVRLEISRQYLHQYIKLIKEYVPLVLTELLFNIDEIGFRDREERMPICILIAIKAKTIAQHCATSRKICRQTLVCCVTATGGAYCPLLISARPGAREAFQHQSCDGINLQIEIAPSPYVTSQIFERYIDTVLMPAVEANRQLPGCEKKPAILFCHSCSAHISESMSHKVAGRRSQVRF
jgi:hypothetical protein